MSHLSKPCSELGRLKIIEDIEAQRLSVVQGAELAGVSRRQMTRLVRAFRDNGPSGLISKKHGKLSNRRHTNGFRDYVQELVRQNYADFGPTLALEKLEARLDVLVAKETLRKWMTEAGIWQTRKERRSRVYQPRNRRDCFGELIQIDGSHIIGGLKIAAPSRHCWFMWMMQPANWCICGLANPRTSLIISMPRRNTSESMESPSPFTATSTRFSAQHMRPTRMLQLA